MQNQTAFALAPCSSTPAAVPGNIANRRPAHNWASRRFAIHLTAGPRSAAGRTPHRRPLRNRALHHLRVFWDYSPSVSQSGLIGTAVSTLAGHWSAKQNAKISRDQWNYQQSNAHQLEVQDLKNAGLNPILSASNSQMASMPQVSDNGASGASANVISSALQAAVSRQNAKTQAETEGQKIKNERDRIALEKEELGYKKERYSWQNKLDESQIGLNDVTGKYFSAYILLALLLP